MRPRFPGLLLSLAFLGLTTLAMPVATARAGVDRWSPIAPPGGTVIDLIVDPSRPSTVYALTSLARSPYKTVDGGHRWVPVGRGLAGAPISAFALDPGAPDHLYLGAGTYTSADDWGFFRSVDGGESWSRMDGRAPPLILRLAVAPAPDSTLYGLGISDLLRGAYGVFRSRDAGASWQAVLATDVFFYPTDLAVDPRSSRTVYLATADGVLRSVDGGDTWAVLGRLENGSPLGGVERVVPAPGDPAVLYATRYAYLFRSADGGKTWRPLPFSLDDYCGRGPLAVHPGDPATLWAGCTPGVLISRDGGASWAAVSAGLTNAIGSAIRVQALAVDPATPEVLYAGAFVEGVFKTTSGGDDWFPASRGIAEADVRLLAFDPISPDVVYGNRWHAPCGEVVVSADGGRSWSALSPVPECLEEPVLAVSPRDRYLLYLGDRRGLWVSRHGGAGWRRLYQGTVNAIAIDPRRPRTMYLGGAGVLRSLDGGRRWTSVLPANVGGLSRNVKQLLVDPTHPGVVYAIGLDVGFGFADPFALRSADDGASWRPLDVPFGSSLQAAPGPPAVVVTGQPGAEGSGATEWWRTEDGGVTWESLTVPGPQLLLVPSRPYLLVTSDGESILRSDDGGESWRPVGSWIGCDRGPRAVVAASGLAPDVLYADGCAGTLATAELVGAEEVALLGGRIGARAAWRDEHGRSHPASSGSISDLTGSFSRAPGGAPEALIKALDARVLDGRFWLFVAGLARSATAVTATDRETGLSRDFVHPAGPPASFGDFVTFPPFPETLAVAAGAVVGPQEVGGDLRAVLEPPDACDSDLSLLCLRDGRFRAAVTWLAPTGGGLGGAIPLADDAGAFWFFREPNVEVALRITEEDAEPGRLRVVWGSLTTLAYAIAVLDTATGELLTFSHAPGVPASGDEAGAFPR